MVPVEILDYIFELLDGDEESLKACSKADPSFSNIVERHLYAHIDIVYYSTNRPHSFSCFQLSKLLSENPQVVKYIRTLQLDLSCSSDGMVKLSSILPMLPKLERMALYGNEHYSWLGLDELFRKTFIDCLLHSLKDLFLSGVSGFPLSILDKCDNLKRLSLRKLHFDRTHPAEQYSPCCPLEYLSINSWPNFSSRLSGVNLRSLRSFVFRPFTDRDFGPLQMLFQACSTSLTTLELFLDYLFSTAYNIHAEHPEMDQIPFTLSVLSCLEQLTIHADMCLCPETNNGNQQFDSAFPSIVKLATTAPSLKQLIFRFWIACPYEKYLPSSIWSPLTILSRSSFKVRIFLSIASRTFVPTFDNLISSFQADTQLMMMIDEGRLVIREGDTTLKEWL